MVPIPADQLSQSSNGVAPGGSEERSGRGRTPGVRKTHPLTDLCTEVPQLRMPAANEEKKPPPEEAAPPPWSLDPIAGDLRGEERAAAHQSVARVGGKRLRVWGGGRSVGYLRMNSGGCRIGG